MLNLETAVLKSGIFVTTPRTPGSKKQFLFFSV